jgi:methyl-accepting chemotaxis protein
VNRSNERSLKADAPLLLENPATERKASTFHYWKDRFDVQPRWNHFLQSPEEALPERRGKPQNESIFWEEVQEDLTVIIREKLPELNLSQRDLQKLTETIRTLQKSMLELGDLERTRSNREEIQKIRSELNRALETLEEMTKMSLSDFILLGRPESGIDNEKPDDEEIIKEYLDHSKS